METVGVPEGIQQELLVATLVLIMTDMVERVEEVPQLVELEVTLHSEVVGLAPEVLVLLPVVPAVHLYMVVQLAEVAEVFNSPVVIKELAEQEVMQVHLLPVAVELQAQLMVVLVEQVLQEELARMSIVAMAEVAVVVPITKMLEQEEQEEDRVEVEVAVVDRRIQTLVEQVGLEVKVKLESGQLQVELGLIWQRCTSLLI